jgi:peptide/nickel transport system substrate-binding protein
VFDPSTTQVLEGAFEVGPDLVVRPNLVSHVEVVRRQPFTLEYHIRPEARWSDGVPVSARDFWFTQRTFANLAQPGDPDSLGRDIYRTVRRSEVVDEKTYRIELREHLPTWRQALYAVVLPRHVLLGKDLTKLWIDRIDDPRTGLLIASGPFLLADYDRGKQITLLRNPRYWGQHRAYLDRLVFRFDPLDAADPLGPIRRNEFDVSLGLGAGAGFMNKEVADQVRGTPGWGVESWPALAAEHLALRVGPGGHPALRDEVVRRALAFGIDRRTITRAIQAEIDRSSRRPLESAVFLPTEPGYRPNWNVYRYDPARARRLFREAGCSLGSDDVFTCSGERLVLRFATTPDATRRQVLVLAQAQLRRAGVRVEVAFGDLASLLPLLSRGELDGVLFSWLPTTGGSVWSEVRCGDAQNWTGFCQRRIERLAQQSEHTADAGQRARVLNDLDRRVARAVPVLPIVQPVLRAAIRASVRGFVPGGTQFHLTQTSEDWWRAPR